MYRGETHISPGRLSAAGDLSLVLATMSNGAVQSRDAANQVLPFLYFARQSQAAREGWASGVVTGAGFATFGGIAVLPGGREFLVATARQRDARMGMTTFKSWPPYYVKRFEMPAGDSEELRVSWPSGELQLAALPVAILLDPDGRRAHVLTDDATVHSIDYGNMQIAGSPIRLQPYLGMRNPIHDSQIDLMHAALSPDARHFVTNRAYSAQLNVADLEARVSWSLDTSPDVARIGGVAINRAAENHELLAIHAETQVLVYRWDPRGPLVEIGRTMLDSPLRQRWLWSHADGPKMAIAWSGDGSQLIAATDVGSAEFAVIDVLDGGSRLEVIGSLEACPQPLNYPNDILTLNELLPTHTPATPTEYPSPTSTARLPTPTPQLSSTPTQTEVSSPTAPPTATSTLTPTPSPRPLYLPLLLRERCTPEHKRADIAMVLDTSSTMTGQKLADAKEAALLFLGMIDLESDRSQVAVVRYDTEAHVVRELTNDREAIEAAIRGLQVRRGTHIDKGLRAALRELQSPRHVEKNQPVVVLLTDGLHSGAHGEELRAAAEVRQAGILLYAIGLGADVDEATLKAMAGDNDRYYHAPDSADLASIYEEIAQDLMCPGVELWGGR
jgi:Mg-chelatase subunit ChlD